MNNYYIEFYEYLKRFKKQKIAFYGASLWLKDFLQEYDLSDFNIAGIIDKDSKKYGQYYGIHKIYSIHELYNDVDIIIFSIKNNSFRIYIDLIKEVPQIKNKLAQNFFEILKLEQMSSNKLYVFDLSGNKKQVQSIKGLTVNWEGCNSTIEISLHACNAFKDCIITCHDNNFVKIDSTNFGINNLISSLENSCQLKIGKDFSCSGVNFIYNEQNKSINIGDDCMFSWGINFRTSDGHTIIDNKTNKVINYGADINIGNHIWIGQCVTIFKGVIISDNSVIGASSLVNKTFTVPNCIIAGMPAKIIRRDINWDRKTADLYIF